MYKVFLHFFLIATLVIAISGCSNTQQSTKPTVTKALVPMEELSIEITENEYKLNGTTYTFKALSGYFNSTELRLDQTVIIVADKNVKFSEVSKVITMIKSSGLSNIEFKTKE